MDDVSLILNEEPKDTARYQGRVKFLKAIVEVGNANPKSKAAKVLKELYEKLFPLYSQVAIPVEHPIQQSNFLTSWEVLDALVPDQSEEGLLLELRQKLANWQSVVLPKEAESLRDENVRQIQTEICSLEECLESCSSTLQDLHGGLRVWAESFHLTDVWCFDHALNTLAFWHRNEDFAGLEWEYELHGFYSIRFDNGFRLSFPHWGPQSETWQSYNKKLEAAFKAAKQKYKTERSAVASKINVNQGLKTKIR